MPAPNTDMIQISRPLFDKLTRLVGVEMPALTTLGPTDVRRSVLTYAEFDEAVALGIVPS